MYVGRIVSIARTKQGNLTAIYRVSSRSFPNRQAKVQGDTVTIVPLAGHESDLVVLQLVPGDSKASARLEFLSQRLTQR